MRPCDEFLYVRHVTAVLILHSSIHCHFKAVILLLSAALQYIAAGHTTNYNSHLLSSTPNDLSFLGKCSDLMTDLAMPSLAMISLMPSPVVHIIALR